MDAPPENAASPFGFLVVGILLCAGFGFAAVDFHAGGQGYDWSSRYFIAQTIAAMIIGSVLGLLLGLILDATITDSGKRRTLLAVAWTALAVGVFAFMVLRPAFQAARE